MGFLPAGHDEFGENPLQLSSTISVTLAAGLLAVSAAGCQSGPWEAPTLFKLPNGGWNSVPPQYEPEVGEFEPEPGEPQ